LLLRCGYEALAPVSAFPEKLSPVARQNVRLPGAGHAGGYESLDGGELNMSETFFETLDSPVPDTRAAMNRSTAES